MAQSRIFLSYARSDDEPFVEKLYYSLTKAGFDVWWDRMCMPNRGLTFLQEILDAIDERDRLILVAGPGAFASDYVRVEWQYAYHQHKGINIVLRLGNYPDLPVDLSTYDAIDFREDKYYYKSLASLKRQLLDPIAPIAKLYNVMAKPEHYLERPEIIEILRGLVITDVDKPTVIDPDKRITAIEGMGGIGKSILATALAHDRKVRFAFPDGIIWLSVGRIPSMYDLYREIGTALDDDLSKYIDETSAYQHVQKRLGQKQCLIILDDLWELTVARTFRDLITGTRTRVLITTRNLQINAVLNINEYRLKLIDRNQAVDYLRSWIGEDPDLELVAENLGYLFLALNLAGARMKTDNLSSSDYIHMFAEHVSRQKLDRTATTRNHNLEVSINLSVEAAFVKVDEDKLLYYTLT